MASKDLHELNNVHTGFPAFLTKFILPDTQTRVIATTPMYDKLYLVGYDVDYNRFGLPGTQIPPLAELIRPAPS
jgi:hypothetical protein